MRSVAAVIALISASPCYAQQGGSAQSTERGPGTQPGWSVTVGVAPVLSPAWLGSRDMSVSLYPDLRINYGETLFASVPEGIGWNAVNADGWRAGPLAKVRFGRDEEEGGSPFLIAGGSDDLLGMRDISATAEVGGFVEKRFDGVPLRARLEVRRGFGGHEGVVADASLSYQARLGRTIMSMGPRATLASDDFMQTFFGVDAGQSSRTGLALYDADGGLVSFGLGGTVVHPLDRRSAVTLFTSLERLDDEAGGSPLIRERGQRDQFSIGVGYGFRFSL